MRERTLKKTSKSEDRIDHDNELRAEYRFDYEKVKPNRFTSRAAKAPLVVMLDSDTSKMFPPPESVNAALRALIRAVPVAKKPRKVHTDLKRE